MVGGVVVVAEGVGWIIVVKRIVFSGRSGDVDVVDEGVRWCLHHFNA